MSQTPEPPTEPRRQEGISLDELAQAFAQVMGAPPRAQGDAEQPALMPSAADQAADVVQQVTDVQPEVGELPSIPPAGEDACPVSPLSILEAMLFVGNRDNKPLSAGKAAELMRDVRLAKQILRPHTRGPFVSSRHRRIGHRGLSATAQRRACKPFARQAQQSYFDPIGAARSA
ncbi:MAG: hypothetical protein ABSA26_06370 [Thermoguttaceae bacterium]